MERYLAWWLSWLERRPVTAEVVGSNPIRVVYPQGYILIRIWDLSSAGRASALQAEGHRFEPCRSHLFADVAQLAEQLICNQQVTGSSPVVGFIKPLMKRGGFPSGQRGQTVNLLATLSKVRILLRPLRNSFR